MTSAKLKRLYDELHQVEAGTHPKYVERLKQIEELYEEQKEREQIAHELALERIDYEYKRRKQQTQDELEKKEKELIQSMLADLDEMEKRIEWEYTNMDVSRTGSVNIVDSTKKTLRGRGGVLIEPPTYFNATPKPTTPNITPDTRYLLTDSQIAEDVRAFTGGQSSPQKVTNFFSAKLQTRRRSARGEYRIWEVPSKDGLYYGYCSVIQINVALGYKANSCFILGFD
ncbi:hypothetical protein COOONC_08500 [Cooperia oncophora]